MEKELYDAITARHYDAYRPPLHDIILNKCMLSHHFENGLDIGCGTGKSTQALKKYCKTVIGLDPSKSMLRKTTPMIGISYEYFDGKHLNFPTKTFDVVTLAGSWWYAKSQVLLDEILKVSKTTSSILLYDFNVVLEPIYHSLRLTTTASNDDYQHFADFSSFHNSNLQLVSKKSGEITFMVTVNELAHLICSEKQVLNSLLEKFEDSNTFEKLVNSLNDSHGTKKIELTSKMYYTNYVVT